MYLTLARGIYIGCNSRKISPAYGEQSNVQMGNRKALLGILTPTVLVGYAKEDMLTSLVSTIS